MLQCRTAWPPVCGFYFAVFTPGTAELQLGMIPTLATKPAATSGRASAHCDPCAGRPYRIRMRG